MADSHTRAEGGTGTAVREIESERAFEDLVATAETALVDFYADWCGPCRMMASTVEELATEGDEAVAKVDVDELPQVAAEHDVQSIPAFVVFEDGEPTDRLVGMQEKSDLRKALE